MTSSENSTTCPIPLAPLGAADLHGVRLRYMPTVDDALWLLRAVEAEGAIQEQVAETLVNCFMYRKAQGSTRLTLEEHVRAYAQPVNPHWYPVDGRPGVGDLHAKFLGKQPGETEAVAIRRRDFHSTRMPADCKQRTVAAVKRALTLGPVDILKNCTDYAAQHIDASRKYTALTPHEPGSGRNRLWTRDTTWTGYLVCAG